ncbi:MAG: cupin domain-containing protein [Pseudomonadota bacterium]
MNGDLSTRVVAKTSEMDWAASPSGTVFRKRVHHVGSAEAGQVTSLVRYQPDARFPAHAHPDGEEILVLDGVFSDEHGDWPAGTYLLNPEGFRHAPFSSAGCLLFVKLRQFPGRKREHHVIETGSQPWDNGGITGVERLPLYEQDGFTDTMTLERWAPGTHLPTRHFVDGAEYFVVAGSFSDADGDYDTYSWLRLPPGTSHTPRTASGCTVYVKTGGFTYLTGSLD